jgi:hypothetical protein
MLLHLILGSAALMAGMFTGGLLLVIIGIRRGDRGKRLAGQPVGRKRTRLREMPRPLPLDAPQGMALPQVPEPP